MTKYIKNAVGRELPEYIEGYGNVKPYAGPFATMPAGFSAGRKLKRELPGDVKLKASLEEAILASGLKDGQTISFHHLFRNGDYVMNIVLSKLNDMGFKNLVLAPSSIIDEQNAAVLRCLKDGTVSEINTSGVRGSLGEYISYGFMEKPVIIRTHGDRARAIECGELKINVAFLGMPSCDEYGNSTGSRGSSLCGSLGYAKVDADYADVVIAITDNLVEYPNVPASIDQNKVDMVLVADKIGDGRKIATGAARATTNPKELLIANYAAEAATASGYFKNGFSMQSGVGATSIAVAALLREKMIHQGITASFAIGGISGAYASMCKEGLIRKLFDTQSFDLEAAESLAQNPNHYEISASFYANPFTRGPVVNKLDFVFLSSLEVDVNFNVNVLTASDGVLMGASGGHSDTCMGANVAIIVTPLVRGRNACIVQDVKTIVTPGETVDVICTERGIAVNPRRTDLIENYKKANLPLCTIDELQQMAEGITGRANAIEYEEKIVAVVEYSDGTVIDVVRKIKD